MVMDLEFVPPQLPGMMSGAQLLTYMSSTYPGAQVQDQALRDLASAMDAYNRERDEYEKRNAVYKEWMTWYRQNPTERDRVVKFVADHGEHFSSSQNALKTIDEAVDRWEQIWGNSGIRDGIRWILEQVATDSQRVSQNLEAIKASVLPADASAAQAGSQFPRVLPQKRPRPVDSGTASAAVAADPAAPKTGVVSS